MFLEAFLSGSRDVVLRNERTGTVVATRVAVAADSRTRRKGLLGRDGMDEGEALAIVPCGGIHMFGMRFPIDVAFVRKDGRVVKCVHAIRPWRIALAPLAFAAIELPAGVLRRTDTRAGDVLAAVESA